jgi:hypothetical protein
VKVWEKSPLSLLLFALVFVAALLGAADVRGANVVEDLIDEVLDQMPRSGSGGFVAPSVVEQSDWRAVVRRMLEGDCDSVTLPATLIASYAIGSFTDVDNGRTYCVLREVGDAEPDGRVDLGWGTFIVNPRAARPLHIDIAHPLFDTNTAAEGIRVFKETDSRTFLMSGAHRNANAAASSCQASYKQADVAHNTVNMFQPTLLEREDFFAPTGGETAIQFHGMGSSSCPGVDVYLTYGRNQAPAAGSPLAVLKSELQSARPGWAVRIPGDAPGCSLHGSSNTQGRRINGVPEEDVCSTAATDVSGRFIHIEQKFDYRDADDWIASIGATWPAVQIVPSGGPWGTAVTVVALLCAGLAALRHPRAAHS